MIQNYIDPSLAENMKNATADQKIDTLFSYMAERGQSFYDEVVTQLEHALQCAALAQQNDAGPTLITSALLHDLGHFILDEHNADKAFLDMDLNHEEIGAQYLEPFFPEAVTTPIRLHVPAKRYLCATDASYHDGLSVATKKSLKVQGGIMNGLETAALETYRNVVQQCLS